MFARTVILALLSAMLIEDNLTLLEVRRIHDDVFVNPNYIYRQTFKMFLRPRNPETPYNKIFLKMHIIQDIQTNVTFETIIYKIHEEGREKLTSFYSEICESGGNVSFLAPYVLELVSDHCVKKAKYEFSDAGTVSFDRLLYARDLNEDNLKLVNTNILSVDGNAILKYNITVRNIQN